MIKRKSILLFMLVVLLYYTATFQSEAIEYLVEWLTPTWYAETLAGYQNLVTGEFIMTTNISEPFRLVRVTLKATEAITETVIVTLASANGAVYSVALDETDMITATDYLYEPEGRALCLFEEDDEISVRSTHENYTGTVYATIAYERVRPRRNR